MERRWVLRGLLLMAMLLGLGIAGCQPIQAPADASDTARQHRIR